MCLSHVTRENSNRKRAYTGGDVTVHIWLFSVWYANDLIYFTSTGSLTTPAELCRLHRKQRMEGTGHSWRRSPHKLIFCSWSLSRASSETPTTQIPFFHWLGFSSGSRVALLLCWAKSKNQHVRGCGRGYVTPGTGVGTGVRGWGRSHTRD